MLARHAAWLPRHVFEEWMRGEGFGLTKGVARAFRLLPRVLRGRAERRRRIAAVSGADPLPDATLFSLARGFRRAPSP